MRRCRRARPRRRSSSTSPSCARHSRFCPCFGAGQCLARGRNGDPRRHRHFRGIGRIPSPRAIATPASRRLRPLSIYLDDLGAHARLSACSATPVEIVLAGAWSSSRRVVRPLGAEHPARSSCAASRKKPRGHAWLDRRPATRRTAQTAQAGVTASGRDCSVTPNRTGTSPMLLDDHPLLPTPRSQIALAKGVAFELELPAELRDWAR